MARLFYDNATTLNVFVVVVVGDVAVVVDVAAVVAVDALR